MITLDGKNILVTGGAGFIGSHLCDRLLKEPVNKLIAIDNLFLGTKNNLVNVGKSKKFIFKNIDVTDFDKLKRIIDQFKINIIFHLAVIPLEVSLESPVWCFDQNIKMTQNILEAIRHNKKRISLVSFSSSEVYGSALYEEMDEEHPLRPNTPYAASKASGDMLINSYSETFGIEYVIIRPFNNYGPRQNDGLYAGIIPITIKKILTGEKPIIFDDGKQTRDFIYVKDTVDFTVKIFKNKRTRGETINLASEKQTSINNVIKLICQELNYKGKIEYRPKRLGDVRKHQGNMEKAKKIISFQEITPLSVGIKETINWYKSINLIR